jgi:hypothetical protein
MINIIYKIAFQELVAAGTILTNINYIKDINLTSTVG